MSFVKIENGLPETDGLYHCRVTYDGENIEKVFLMWSLDNWHTDVDMEGAKIISWLDEQDEGWVPVSDRLPEINQKVLILENDDMYTSFWDGTYSKDKRKMPQFPDGQDEQPGYYWPSHWRPLPAPPATT